MSRKRIEDLFEQSKGQLSRHCSGCNRDFPVDDPLWRKDSEYYSLCRIAGKDKEKEKQ